LPVDAILAWMETPATTAAALVCVVSTIKDIAGNLDRFVSRNLAAGADHLFVFLDDADPDTHAHLDEHPHVTAVRTDAGYWHDQRPGSLNERQVVNANVANVLLSVFPEVAWLFHVDGDECLDLDRDRLLGLDTDATAVRLRTLESVAVGAEDEPRERFKRPLEPDELALLATLGEISEPSMLEYFNGHVQGKSGMRPSLDRRLQVHAVASLDLEPVEPVRGDWLNVLHYESFSVQEFTRKWTAHLDAVTVARFRDRRERLRASLGKLMSLELDEDRRRELLAEIHRRHIEDDVALLDELGFLVRPQPEWHAHRPVSLSEESATDLDEMLGLLREADKDYFRLRQGRPPRELLAELVDRAEGESLRERLREATAVPEVEADEGDVAEQAPSADSVTGAPDEPREE